jgi:membrane protein required for colicin V production
MNWLDIVIIVLLLISAVGGFANGLIKSVFSLVGLIVGVVVAGRYYLGLSSLLGFIPNENIARIIAFLIIFLVIIIIAAVLGVVLTRLVSTLLLGWLNRLGGAVFGVIMSAIFIAAILVIWIKYLGGNSVISGSAITRMLVDGLPLVLALLPKEFDIVHQFFQ